MRESLPRIAYISLPPEQIYLSFPAGKVSPIVDGVAIRNGDIVLAGRGACMHQRSSGECQWGLISLSPERFASCGKALTGRQVHIPQASRILRPARTEMSRFQRLFKQVCRLAEARQKLIEHHEVARALEEELFHAIINCLTANETDDNPKTRRRHAAVMVRFEETLSKRIDQKINVPALCAEIGVPERTLRMCCVAEFLGVSPKTISSVATFEQGSLGAPTCRSFDNNRCEGCPKSSIRGTRAFCSGVPHHLRKSPSATLQQDPQI